jgi:hypothetical protein
MTKPTIKRIAIVASTATLAVAGLAVVSMPSSQTLTHTQLTNDHQYQSTGANVPQPSSSSGIGGPIGALLKDIQGSSPVPALDYQNGICTLGGKVVSVTHCTSQVVPASQVEAFVRHEVAGYHVNSTMARTIYWYIMLTNFPSLTHSTD